NTSSKTLVKIKETSKKVAVTTFRTNDLNTFKTNSSNTPELIFHHTIKDLTKEYSIPIINTIIEETD
ncbi:16068_t:CDS:1, partial [Gigaspora margarita]